VIATNIRHMRGVAGSHQPQWLDALARECAVVEETGVRPDAMRLRNLPSQSWEGNCEWMLAANLGHDPDCWVACSDCTTGTSSCSPSRTPCAIAAAGCGSNVPGPGRHVRPCLEAAHPAPDHHLTADHRPDGQEAEQPRACGTRRPRSVMRWPTPPATGTVRANCRDDRRVEAADESRLMTPCVMPVQRRGPQNSLLYAVRGRRTIRSRQLVRLKTVPIEVP
jgi:hypothetical protein